MKTRTIIKRTLAVVLAFVLVAGLGLSYSADRILKATSIPEEELEAAEKVVEKVEKSGKGSSKSEEAEPKEEKKEEKKAEEKPVEKKGEEKPAEKKEEKKDEEKPAEKAEEKPAENKEEKKAEEKPSEKKDEAPAESSAKASSESESSGDSGNKNSSKDSGSKESQDSGSEESGRDDGSQSSKSDNEGLEQNTREIVIESNSEKAAVEEQTSVEENTEEVAPPAVTEEETGTEEVAEDEKTEEEIEEEAEEEEEEEEETKYPAQRLTATASDGATVVVNAPEGALPEGSKVRISVVSAASAINAVDNMLGDDKEVVSAKAYDITIYDKNGKEIQPDSSVKVSLRGAGVGGGDETGLYHMQGGSASKVADVQGNSASFSASHFSVYVFVEIDTVPEAEDDGISITLSDSILKLESIGHKYQLEAKVNGVKGDVPPINWESNDPSVASVDENGNVTAVSEGSCSVIASVTIGEGAEAKEYKANATVEVMGVEAISMILNRNVVVLGESGEETTLGVTFKGLPEGSDLPAVTWASSDEEVATVNDGAITALGAGSAVITATSVINGETYSANAKVTVKAVRSAIRISPEEVIMNKSETASLEAVLVGISGDSTVTWSSSDTDIVSVAADGADSTKAVITAKGVGKATVKASVKGSSGVIKAEAKVSVSDSGTWSNGEFEMNWHVDQDGILTLSGTGELKMDGQTNGGFAETKDEEGVIGVTPWNEWRNRITEVVIGEGITTIGPRAFEGCQNLYKVTFNNKETLTSIGYGAFYRCHKLIEIDLSNCVNLTTLEGGTTSAEHNGAFSHGSWRLDNYNNTVERSMVKIDLTGCTNLKTIGDSAFYGRRYIDFDMSDLTGLEEVGSEALEDKHEFNAIDFSKFENLKTVGYKAFKNNTGIVVIDMSGNTNLESIGEMAFLIDAGFYSSLTTVDLSDCSNLKSIGKNAFGFQGKGEKTLTSVNLLGTAITEIKDNTFLNQSSLAEVSIPKGVTNISTTAFKGCSGIRKLTWDVKNYTGNGGKIGSVFSSISNKSGMTVTIGADVEKLPSDFFTQLNGAKFVFEGSEDGSSRTISMNLDGKGYKDYIIDSEGHIYLKADELGEELSHKIRNTTSAPLWIEYDTAEDLVYNGTPQNIVFTNDPGEGAKLQYKVGKNGTWDDVRDNTVTVVGAGTYEVYFRLVSAAQEAAILAQDALGLNVTVDKAQSPVKVDTHALSLKPGDAYDFSNRVSGEIPEGVTIKYSFGSRSSGRATSSEAFGSVDDFKSAGRSLNGSKYRAGTTTGMDIIVITVKDSNNNYREDIYKIPVRVEGEPRIYTVTFKANGGSFPDDGGGNTYTVSGSAGTKIYQPTPYRDGYIFEGWNAGVPATLMRDATFNANWTKIYNVTLTAPSKEKDYDGAPLTAEQAGTVTASGLPSGYTVEATVHGSQTEVGSSASTVADGYVIKDAGGNNVNKYCKVTLAEGTLTVKPAAVTVSITGRSLETVYNGTEQSVKGYDITGISNPAYFASDFTFSGEDKAAGTDVGETAMGLSAEQFTNNNDNFDNVVFKITDGKIVITPKEISVNADPKSKAFGEKDPELTAVINGLISGEDEELIKYDLSRDPGEEAGEYTITAAGDVRQGNYSVSYVPAKFLISKSKLTVTAVNYSGEYDGETHSGGATVSTPQGTTLTYSTDGGKTWKEEVPSIMNCGTVDYLVKAENPNFDEAISTGRLAVARKNVTVKATDASKTYGDPDPQFDAEVTGLVPGEDSSVIDYTVSRDKGEDAGTYVITLSGDAEQGNYAVSFAQGTLTIKPLAGVTVTITGRSDSVMYDGKRHAVSGFAASINNDQYLRGDFVFTGEKESASGIDAGTYSIGLTKDQFENRNSNFTDVNFVVTDGELTITPKPATVSALSACKTYGEDDPELSADIGGVIAGDTLEYTLTREKGENVGEYTITAAGDAEQGNYTVTYNNGVFSIIKSGELPLDANGYYGIYDGEEHSASASSIEGATIEFSVDGGSTWSADAPSIRECGKQSVLVRAQHPNYEEKTTEVYLEVCKAPVTVTAVDRIKIYGDSDPAFTASVTGNIGRDKIEYTISRTPGEDAGSYAITPDGPAEQGNYEVTFVPGALTIEPLGNVEVAITGNNNTAPYDGAEHSVRGFTATFSNALYKAEDFTFSGSESDAFAAQRNAGTAYMGLKPDQFTNTNGNFTNVRFVVEDGYQTITPISAEVKITGHSSSVPYDGKEHSVSGYDFESADPLYKAEDFTFSGSAETEKITEAGTAAMGLRAEQFTNNNSNYDKVIFKVTDGVQTVLPIEADVYVTGHNASVTYDGSEHSVSGYDVEISNELYKESDFNFSGSEEAKGTENGTTAMGLAAEQFTNNNPNFSTVRFHVTDGYLTIVPVDEVVVTITGHTSILPYDGEAHSVSGYDVEISNELYKESDFTFNGSAEASREDAGTSEMGLRPGQFSNTNRNFSKVIFNVTDGYQKIEPVNVSVDITGHHDSSVYDGESHTVSGYDVSISSELYTTADFSFDGNASASRTDAGRTEMGLKAEQFMNRNPNFSTVTFNVNDGWQNIEPAAATVTIAGHNATAAYDGNIHAVSGYDVKTDSKLYTEDDFTFNGSASASRTDAGTTVMDLSAEQFSNNNPNFSGVTFNVTDGWQKVEPITATVDITGNSSTVPYDGEEHSVTGYTAAADTPLYDTDTDITFSGSAAAARRDAGETEMGLTAEQFINNNPNFSEVTFNVTDGQQTVTPISANVIITGHSDTVKYDGEEHAVSGYDVEISNPLYTKTAFTFSGNAEAKRTEEGTTEMGLEPEQFTNEDPNFTDVNFSVTDGTMTVTPVDEVVVTITGRHVFTAYDGKKHTASGYEVSISDPLYSEADFEFTPPAGSTDENGEISVSRRNAGSTAMGLEASQFRNKNRNFAKVVFEVTDGGVTIDPINVTVEIKGHKLSEAYDGKEHAVSGYDTVISDPLYTEEDIAFSGSAEAKRTDAGTTAMGLAAGQFSSTNSNFADVTFVIEDGSVTVDPVSAAVTITGHNSEVDYDGNEHTVTGYDVITDSELYKAEDFTFNGSAEAKRKDAGTTAMGLEPAQFRNTNSNFSSVTFEVIDGFQTIDPIEATVVITGHTGENDYDGKAHSVSGYDVEISNPLYSLSDFTFSGSAAAERTNAGKTKMGLKAGQFTNTNGNFSSVTFEVTDGWQTIDPIDAEVTIRGRTSTFAFDGAEHHISGYDVEEISSPLYSESDIVFTPASTASFIGGIISAARTDQGRTDMGLAAEQFTNRNENFRNVTFNVIDGWQVITPVEEVVVKITGRSSSVAYDGKPHSVSGYDVEISNPLYSVSDFTFSGSAEAEQTDAGKAVMGLSEDQFANSNSNFAKVTFEVIDGWQAVTPITAEVTVIGRSDRKDYNGKEHAVSGYNVTEISTGLYHESDFTFTGTAEVSRTDVGRTDMGLKAEQFVNRNPNFSTVTFNISDGYMIIEPVSATVTITGHNATAAYDGQQHKVSGYDIDTGTELLKNSDIKFSGSSEAVRTDAGTTPMGLASEMFSNTNPNFSGVTFNVTDGWQTVEPITATVDITGHYAANTYNGSEFIVSGYDVAISDPLYKESDFSFCGKAEARRRDTGTTQMGLKADQFINNNPNFSEVTFNVTDGYQTVNAVGEVSVMIVGHNDTAVYDGTEHSVTGYDVRISDPLYKESDFTFTPAADAQKSGGTIAATGTDAGTFAMGLEAEQFTNNNTNFDKVTFSVSDGSLTIMPADIELTAASAEREYTGSALTDGGYEITGGAFAAGDSLAEVTVEGSQTLPGKSENIITGYTFAEGTRAENYNIRLKPGTLEVTDRSEKYDILMEAVSGSAMYDRNLHTAEGFKAEEFNVGGNTFSVSGLTAAASGTDAGDYESVISGTPLVTDSEGNNVTSQFNVDTVTGLLKIGRRTVILTSDSKTETYTGNPLTADGVTVSGDGFAEGEGASYTVTGYQIVVGIAKNLFEYVLNENTKAQNYNIIVQPGILTVTSRDAKYSITVEANSGQFLYDGEEKTVSGLVCSNFMVANNRYTVSGLEASASAVHAGEYAVTVSGTPVVTDAQGNDVTDQFSVEAENGKLVINKRNVKLTSATANAIYSGDPLTDKTVTVSGDGFAKGEGAEYDVTGSRTIVGSNENTFTYTLGKGTLAEDYNITTEYGTLTVTNRPDDAKYEITVKAASGHVMYDGSEHSASGFMDSSTGDVIENGEPIAFTIGGHSYTVSGLTASRTETKAGTYSVNITGTPAVFDENGHDVSAEFVVNTQNGTLSIDKRKVTLTSGSATHAYTGTPLTEENIEVSGDGFANGEGATYDVTGSRTLVGTSPNTFTYTLEEGTDADNYDITTVEGELTIIDRDAKYLLTLTPNSAEYIYDGKEKSVSGFISVTAEIDGVKYNIDGMHAEASATDAGVYTVTAGGSPIVTDEQGNDVTDQFAVETKTGTLTIRPRGVVLSTDDVSREYDGTPLEGGEVSVGGDGFAGDDGVEILSVASRTLPGVTENSFEWRVNDGTNPNNYDISTLFGLISVTNRDAKYAITLIANSDDIEYDGEEHSVNGFKETEFNIDGNVFTVSEVDAGAVGTEVGIYGTELSGDAVIRDSKGADVTGQFAVTYESGKLTITPKQESQSAGGNVNGNSGADNNGGGNDGGSDDNGGSGGSTEIGENTVPYSRAPSGYWALFNLIMMIVTAILAVINMIRWTSGRRKDDQSDNEGFEYHDSSSSEGSRKGSFTLMSMIAAIVAVIAFFLTEDMTNTMAYTDRYTILMAVILIVAVITTVFGKENGGDSGSSSEEGGSNDDSGMMP